MTNKKVASVKAWMTVGVAVGSMLLLSGCSGSATATTGSAPTGSAATGNPSCPAGPVVAWSSEEASPSRLTAVADGAATTVGSIPVKGIVPGGVSGHASGDHAYFLSGGDARHDVTHLVHWLPGTCRGSAVELPGIHSPLGFATDGARFYATETVNARTIIHRYDARGTQVATATLPDIVATCLALDGGTLYAFATQFHDGAPDSVVLVALDSDTMAVRSRHPLPLAPGPVASAVVHGGKLYYPLTANESTGTQGHALAVLDPTTFTETTIDLGARLPYALRLVGDTLYVAHTFINPAFGPLSSLRHLSRIDLRTGTVTGRDLDTGIVDIAADARHVYLIGQDVDLADDFVVQTYDATTLARTASVPLTRPKAGGYYYPAGVLAPATS